MARGWESKSVESQIEDRQQARGNGPARKRTPAEQERARKRRGLELSRTRIRTEMAATRSEAHRATLEKALAFLEDELQRLGAEGPESDA